jgi:hypothetical protein
MNEEGVWQEILQNKYLKTKTLSQVIAKPLDSTFLERFNECKGQNFQLRFSLGRQ